MVWKVSGGKGSGAAVSIGTSAAEAAPAARRPRMARMGSVRRMRGSGSAREGIMAQEATGGRAPWGGGLGSDPPPPVARIKWPRRLGKQGFGHDNAAAAAP